MKRFFTFILTFVMLTVITFAGVGARANAAVQDNNGYYSVVFNSNTIPAEFNKQLISLGGEIVYSVPEIGFVQIKCNSNSLSKIKQLSYVNAITPSLKWSLPEVQRVEMDEELLEMNETAENSSINPENREFWKYQWDIHNITNNGESYKIGTGSHNTVIGIIDTGIDRDHKGLVKNIMPGSKNFVPAGGFRGREAYETGDINAFDDLHGHGSHVAGSIAGDRAIVGVAPNIGIRSYRVFGKSSAESAWIINAMIAAANDGVDVMSMSLGGFDLLGQMFRIDPQTGKKENLGNDVADYIAYKRAVKYAQDKNVLIVVAAGNDAINCTNKKEVTDFLNKENEDEGIYFVGAGFNVPSTYPNVVTVSSTGPNNELALYSNYGPGFINIAAPGGDTRIMEEYDKKGLLIIYLLKKLFYKEWCLSTAEDGNYYWSVGTSMATPKVSAVAGLIIDKYGKISPNKTAEILYKKGVIPVSGTDNAYFGSGYLNAYEAIK